MYRGTTPTITLNIGSSLNLTQISNLWVTFKWGTQEKTFEKSNVSIDSVNKKITVELSQADTLAFSSSNVRVQMRILMNDGKAYATNIATLQVNDILKGGVLGGNSAG